ncbi:MAG: hypothetical protein ACRDTT_10520 [Pseudonocardiaceae bacterium]
MVLIREGADWLFFPHGVTGLAVSVSGPEAVKVATTILGQHP